MGALGGLLGSAGGQNGTGFATVNPVNSTQINQGIQGAQGALGSQQALLAALQGQGGLGQQNAIAGQLGQGVANQNALYGQLQGQNGLGNQTSVYNQLQGVANGTGPNPAQAMLNQATGQNVANQAALMAGQRGAGQNAGLLARQAAQQGASTQQQAVGQGATMQANQRLAALGQLGSQANTMAGQQINQANTLGQQQIGQANQIAGQQIGQQNAVTAAQQAQQAAMINAQNAYNNQQVAGMTTQMQGQQGLIGGALSSIGSMLSAPSMAAGGEVGGYADGGSTEFPGSPQSEFGQFLNSQVNAGTTPSPGPDSGAAALQQGVSKLGGAFKPPSMGGSPSSVGDSGVAESGMGAAGAGDLSELAPLAMLAAKGGRVDYSPGGKVSARKPAEKASKPGDNYGNDKIPAVLSEHEIVIPRSVTMSKDPVRGAAQFVAQTIAKRGKK